MNDGTLCFIGEDKYHYTFPDHTESYVRSKLFLSSEELSGLIQVLNKVPHISERFSREQITIGSLDAQNMQLAEQIFSRLDQISPQADYYQAELYSALLRLIILLGENNHAPTDNTLGAMQTAVDYINEHITENIGIEAVCSEIYMSKYHFCREFKKKIGMTVMEYILKTRITMAKELLCEGRMSVTEISEACGFSSISYFSRVFKNETNLTPLQYKRENTRFQ
jgi:AraC-like DNA-binding protein